jgi:protein SCO1/2
MRLGSDLQMRHAPPATAVHSEADAPRPRLIRAKWLLWSLALVVGLGAGAMLALLHRTSRDSPAELASSASGPVATWAANTRQAPRFMLTNQNGRRLSLAEFKGRPVIVTFLDPLCRNFCPLEARILSKAVRQIAPNKRPAIISVSVDPWADSTTNFREDAIHWDLNASWHWGVGRPSQLARVWKNYEVGVQVTKKTIAGVTVREISHTEAAYLIDSTGHERALLMYPFQTADVIRALAAISGR